MLKDKVAVVTGAGRGIGREVALELARNGAKVVVNDLGAALSGGEADTGPAEAVAAEIRGAGGEAVASTASVASPEGAQGMVEQAVATFGRIDCLVHAAGILRDRMVHRMTVEDWDAVLDVHLKGAFLVSQAAIIRMREQESGSIVLFSSTAGTQGGIGQGNYAAAKAGMIGLARSLALEGARQHVRANAFIPFAWTRMLESIPVKSEDQAAAFERQRTTMRAEQMAPVVAYLCSDAAAGISGQVVGCRGNEVYLFSQPRPVKTIHRSDGWTVERLAAVFEPAMHNHLADLHDTAGYFTWDPI